MTDLHQGLVPKAFKHVVRHGLCVHINGSIAFAGGV